MGIGFFADGAAVASAVAFDRPARVGTLVAVCDKSDSAETPAAGVGLYGWAGMPAAEIDKLGPTEMPAAEIGELDQTKTLVAAIGKRV